MAKAKNKTVKTTLSVEDFLGAIENEQRREDCKTVAAMMADITGWKPYMWGNIVGFGEYHYKYDSGREGDSIRTGFASRKTALTIYIMPGYTDFSEILARLGKHKLGKSCLYIKRLSDIDETVLRELIEAGLADMAEKYPL